MKIVLPQLQQELDQHRQAVDVDYFDLTVREVIRMADEEELIRAPEYQRRFRWELDQRSRLIESFFLGLPVPAIYTATNKDGKWELVDGLQRVSTLIHFASSSADSLAAIGESTPLRLTGLEKLKRFNDLTYSELPTPLQLAFSKRLLRVTALSDKSNPAVRFEMFERLNTGGVALTAQEVRSCVYRGSAYDFLKDLSQNQGFRKLLKLQRSHQADGTHEEQVLKFFAYLRARDLFEGDVTGFLNEFLSQYTKSFDPVVDRKVFENAVAALYKITQGPLIRKGYANTPLNQFEAILVAIAELQVAGRSVKHPAGGWLQDEELLKYSTKGTNTINSLMGRVKRAKALLS
jgi:hypothetical protein